MTTEAELSSEGELLGYSIYPEQVQVAERLTYNRADEILGGGADRSDCANYQLLSRLADLAVKLRERRRRAGAYLVQRREPKVVVHEDGEIEISIIDSSSPSRELVAELMVLSNYIAARSAADRGIPMIFRVQPNFGEDGMAQRPRLSLHAEFHAGVGLDCYVQASSPIRRYVDLVLQRQLLGMTSERPEGVYQREELLEVLAAAETVESEGRELERRARRYWTLVYLQRHALDGPLDATVMRDGGSAELEAFGVRGNLRGAPNLPPGTRVAVKVTRIDPLHGLLTLSYVRTLVASGEAAD
jgi:exoribonuclease-2